MRRFDSDCSLTGNDHCAIFDKALNINAFSELLT